MNEAILEARLAALEKARVWSPRVMSKLEALLRSADPWALFRVSPVAFGLERGIPEQEAVDVFLHAARAGLFRLEWRLLCPGCGDTLESLGSLKMVQSRCFCTMCHFEAQAHLDDFIHVSFTVEPEVREAPFHRPESLSVDDYYFRFRLDPTALSARTTGTQAALFKSMKRWLGFLEPGAVLELPVEAEPGLLVGHDLLNGQGFVLELDRETTTTPQPVSARFDDRGWTANVTRVKLGPVALRVENARDRRASLFVMQLPRGYLSGPAVLKFPPALTANKLLNSQTFRTLYRGEVIGSTEGIGVKDLTLLFTDLKGSTELYERIGDIKAFALVQRHFDHLGRAVQTNGGAIVKTIGDAVMASFDRPTDALKAALAMLQEIEAFNTAEGTRQIVLKIGIHRGPSIAVTLNERVDYFGQTVNIAARVQAIADAEEVCVTGEVIEAPGVRELLPKLSVKEELATLKGIKRQVPVWRLRA